MNAETFREHFHSFAVAQSPETRPTTSEHLKALRSSRHPHEINARYIQNASGRLRCDPAFPVQCSQGLVTAIMSEPLQQTSL